MMFLDSLARVLAPRFSLYTIRSLSTKQLLTHLECSRGAKQPRGFLTSDVSPCCSRSLACHSRAALRMPDEDDSRSPSVGSGSIPPSAFAAVPALAVFRPSPRPCVNQALVDELKPLRDLRFLLHGSE